MTRANRRLVVHLGLSKTGTTTIQSFCRKNARALRRQGVVYPNSSEAFPDHPAFRVTLMKPRAASEVNHGALAHEIRIPEGGRPGVGARPLWTAARREFDRAHAHTALVSYENFYLNVEGYDFGSVRNLFADVEWWAIIYLRRPEDWAPSLYGQSIRGKARRSKPFGRFARAVRRNLAYSQLLDAISESIGCSRLVVRDFDEARKVGLVEDFLENAELAPSGFARDTGNSRNSSPPWWVVLFLLQCNRAGIPDDIFLEVRKALNRAARDGGVMIRPGLHVATPDELDALRTVRDDDAARLAALYGVRFGTEEKSLPDYRPFDEDDLATIREAIRGALSDEAARSIEGLGCGAGSRSHGRRPKGPRD